MKANAQEVNDLNVFPIPDGDTGDNMCSTMRGGVDAVNGEQSQNLAEVSDKAARGMLLRARGNSGVILSQIFAGINKGFAGVADAGVADVIFALEQGVKSSYLAVEKPVEGTILTVFRQSVEYAKEKNATNGKDLCKDLSEGAKISLEKTPEMLEVLKEAGVVDSGGKGICYIIAGALAYLNGEEIEDAAEKTAPTAAPAKDVDFSLFGQDSVMKFGYCTEFLLQLTNAKTKVEEFKVNEFIEGLKTLGDSIVCFLTGSVVKVHIHSFNPDRILAYALKFGEFLTMKIENMTLQHNETLVAKQKYNKNEKRKPFGVVTVATGEGLTKTFTEQGADVVIFGGQGNNPSLEDFLEAYDAVNADDIFVLPNNANILLVAKASASEYKGSKIHVIPSKTIGDGYLALSMLDYSSGDSKAIADAMIESMAASVTGLVCKATRDANMNAVEILKDNYLGFSGKDMLCSDKERLDVAFELLEKLNAKEKFFLVTIYGCEVDSAERARFEEKLAKTYPNLEFYGVDGGQDVFDYVVVME